MTREEARKAAKVMKAYADGKDIEYLSHKSNKWELVCRGDDKHSNLALDFHKYKYRIKKEPTYRPFKDKEECWEEMQKHQPFGWINHKGTLRQVLGILDCAVRIEGLTYSGYKEEFEEVKFADGTPFGIKEE